MQAYPGRNPALAPSSMLAAGSSDYDADAAMTAPGSNGVAGVTDGDLPDLGPERSPTTIVDTGARSRGGSWTAAGDGGRGGWRQT